MYNAYSISYIELLKEKPSLVIIDTPFELPEKIQEYVESIPISLGLDWFHHALLDYNLIVFRHDKIPKAKIGIFEGFKYVIIDHRIREITVSKGEKNYNNVLIVIGGGDIKNQSLEVVEILKDKGFSIQLVLGPNNCSDISKISKIKNLSIKKNVANMASVIETSDWMVTNGGGCLFEAMCSGRPVFALGQTAQEINIIEQFKERNLLAGYSVEDLRLIGDSSQIKSNSLTHDIIDGDGGYRITKLVGAILGGKE